MSRRIKEIIYPHLNDRNGNLEKIWYVEYSMRNPVSKKMERIRVQDGFKELNTKEERYLHAKNLIKDLTKKINSGKIQVEETVSYKDFLTYNGSSFFKKERKAFVGSIKLHISKFLEYKETEISSRTMETYKSKMRMFSAFLEKKELINKSPSLITNDLIVEFLKNLSRDKNLAILSVGKYQQILYTFFSYLIKNKKLISENPVTNIPRIGVIKDKAPAAIPQKIREKLYNLIIEEDGQLWMAICFIYYAAIRPGTELRLMKLSQINYDLKTITVKNYLAKNGRTEIIEIPDQLYLLITEEWKLQNYDQDLYVFGKEGIPSEKHLGKNSMRVRFNKFRDRLNLSHEIK